MTGVQTCALPIFQNFFQNRDADAVRNNPEFFNFDGGQSPDVSVGDVQALFMDFVDGE